MGPNEIQVWDQNWWNANPTYGTAEAPALDFGPQKEGGITINDNRQRSAPSGTVLNGMYWDHLKGGYMQAPQGIADWTQWTPEAGWNGTVPGWPTGSGASPPPATTNPQVPVGGGGGGGAGAGGTPGMAQITPSITPQGVYSNKQTATARNMAVNDAMRSASSVSAYKQFDRPGASRSLATSQRAMPQIAKAYTNAAQAKAGIPLADTIANEQNLFQGQLARANEMAGLGKLALGEQSLNNYQMQQLLASLGPLLGSLF